MVRSRGDIQVLAVALIVTAFGCAEVAGQAIEGTFERTLQVTGPVDLAIQTGSGSIDVRPGAGGQVRIVGRIRASSRDVFDVLTPEEKVKRLEANPPVEQQGNVIRVGRIEDDDLRQNVRISYEVTVPTQTALHSRSGSGDQTIDGISGPVSAQSGSGNVRIGEIGGDVDATAGSGDVEVGVSKGRVTLHTGSGSIVARSAGAATVRTGSGDVRLVQDAEGDIEVASGSGDISIENLRGGLRARSASGDVRVDGVPRGSWSLSTTSGDVELALPAELGFELDAVTSSGQIDAAHPVTVAGTFGRRRVQGTVRGGGPRLEIHTTSGDIVLR